LHMIIKVFREEIAKLVAGDSKVIWWTKTDGILILCYVI
jgi:hypothetical protein